MSCVAVMGFYRTGSSGVAGLLHHLGVFMGEQFDAPNENNPQGYWEDLEFKNLHKAMLESKDVEAEYIALIRRREQHKRWGVKDPRLCLLLPNLFKNLQTQHQIIHTTRDLAGIQESMLRGNPDMTVAQFHTMYQIYSQYEAQWLAQYPQPILHVDYSELADSETLTNKIASFMRMPVNIQALGFIIPKTSPEPMTPL